MSAFHPFTVMAGRQARPPMSTASAMARHVASQLGRRVLGSPGLTPGDDGQGRDAFTLGPNTNH